MSTSFIQIKAIKTKKHLQERVTHIVQPYNRFKGVFDNIIYINEEFSQDTETKNIPDAKATTVLRSKLTRTIGSYKNQLNKQTLKLKNAQFISDQKGISRAESAIARNEAKIKELTEQRDSISDSRKDNAGGNKISYREIVFSITGVRHLLEDEQYSNRLYNLSRQFLEDNLNAKLIKAVIHRDQPGNVQHIHYLIEYDADNSFTNDMKLKYKDDEKHIQDLAIEWEQKIKQSRVVEQFHIDYEDIVKNGKREYKTLAKFKREQKETLLEVTEEAKKETQQLKSKLIKKSKDSKGNIDKVKVLNSLLNTVKAMKIEFKLLVSSLSTNKLLKKNNQLNSTVEKLTSDLERNERLSDEFYQENVKNFDKRVRAKNTALVRSEHKLSKLEKSHTDSERVNKENITKVAKLTLSNQELQARVKSLESQLGIMQRAKIKIGSTLKKLRSGKRESNMSLIDLIGK
ncbi:hypothetical protein [Candidatus Sulfurimonas baltica]|uniref:Uncharacterized protein n=1 Tax=Candidatus Sulfurimonas baltica TaxID=2740404 RepID=A0A7S7LVW5_9BACT|nr:hypothetical protein [Candidatus Sulfurimonas baltica]QOY52300.1 hypothetical protein HUE88_00985 [Candidatus Sulfurimonas baltica]